MGTGIVSNVFTPYELAKDTVDIGIQATVEVGDQETYIEKEIFSPKL